MVKTKSLKKFPPVSTYIESSTSNMCNISSEEDDENHSNSDQNDPSYIYDTDKSDQDSQEEYDIEENTPNRVAVGNLDSVRDIDNIYSNDHIKNASEAARLVFDYKQWLVNLFY